MNCDVGGENISSSLMNVNVKTLKEFLALLFQSAKLFPAADKEPVIMQNCLGDMSVGENLREAGLTSKPPIFGKTFCVNDGELKLCRMLHCWRNSET